MAALFVVVFLGIAACDGTPTNTEKATAPERPGDTSASMRDDMPRVVVQPGLPGLAPKTLGDVEADLLPLCAKLREVAAAENPMMAKAATAAMDRTLAEVRARWRGRELVASLQVRWIHEQVVRLESGLQPRSPGAALGLRIGRPIGDVMWAGLEAGRADAWLSIPEDLTMAAATQLSVGDARDILCEVVDIWLCPDRWSPVVERIADLRAVEWGNAMFLVVARLKGRSESFETDIAYWYRTAGAGQRRMGAIWERCQASRATREWIRARAATDLPGSSEAARWAAGGLPPRERAPMPSALRTQLLAESSRSSTPRGSLDWEVLVSGARSIDRMGLLVLFGSTDPVEWVRGCRDVNGWHAVHHAAWRGRADFLQALVSLCGREVAIDKGTPPVGQGDASSHATPLLLAVLEDRSSCVRCLAPLVPVEPIVGDAEFGLLDHAIACGATEAAAILRDQGWPSTIRPKEESLLLSAQ
ncbi:MAG: hypothetical protein IPK26_17895 [Planctomycetes bacterium]|nr:hypothetical protein [Planctomycetota bacterium]